MLRFKHYLCLKNIETQKVDIVNSTEIVPLGINLCFDILNNLNNNKMSKKLDLNTYLSKYSNNPDLKKKTIDFQQPESSKKLNTVYSKGNLAPMHDFYHEQTPIVHIQPTTQQQFYGTNFQRAQLECLEQLQEIKRALVEEEKQMSYFMDSYYKKIHENMLQEHLRIKDELLEMFEKSFEENERRINQNMRNHGSSEPIEFLNIRKRVAQINAKIEKLEQGLRGQNYRVSIADVVTSDFDSEMRDIKNTINNSQRMFMENNFNLGLDQVRYNRIREDLENLIIFEDPKRKPMIMQQSHQQTRKSSRPKPPLFESSINNPHQNRDLIQQGSSNFFNFNN